MAVPFSAHFRAGNREGHQKSQSDKPPESLSESGGLRPYIT
jgi:hypothetical protein